MDPSPRPTTAAAPFDGSFANIILRSSDNVDFYVYKEIMIMASQVFRDMFDIPQPPAADRSDLHPQASFPIISLTETSATLRPLLRLCCPVADPTITSVEALSDVIEAAHKYEMKDALQGKLRESLDLLSSDEPVKVYVVACYLGLKYITDRPLDSHSPCTFSYDPLFDKISAADLFRLLDKRRSCGSRRRAFQESITLKCNRLQCSSDFSLQPEDVVEVSATMAIPPNMGKPAKISLCSYDGALHLIHNYILATTSPILAQMYLDHRDSVAQTEQSGSPSYLILAEDAYTVNALLCCCHPDGHLPSAKDLESAGGLLVAARKYGIARAVLCASDQWTRLVADQPLHAYFLAMKHGWELEAAEPAHQLLFQQELRYISAMEEVSAKMYHRLLDFKYRFLKHINDRDFQLATHHWSCVEYNTSNDKAGLFDYFAVLDHHRRPFTMQSVELHPCRC